MASLRLTGDRKLRAKLARMQNVQRIASPAVRDALSEAEKTAKRSGFGFVNRTGRLRGSLRIEQARDVRGRYATAWQLVAGTPYAAYVEWKRRTRDRRPGPPYWLHRAVMLARRRIERRLTRNMKRELGKEARRP